MSDKVMEEIERLVSNATSDCCVVGDVLWPEAVEGLARIAREERRAGTLYLHQIEDLLTRCAALRERAERAEADNARLREALTSALGHVQEHLTGCLFCGGDEEFVEEHGEVSPGHAKECWYESARSALRGGEAKHGE